jgi:hypothetical protein
MTAACSNPGVCRAARHLLAPWLALAALIGATTEYCEIFPRRVLRRRQVKKRSAAHEAGMRGRVRVLLSEG